jgi:hypothetical protein
MTDLISKVDKLILNDSETIQKLLTKYKDVLNYISSEKEYVYHVFFINYCVNVIKKNHDNENLDWKAWACLILFRLYRDNKINKLDEIPEIISEFFEFRKKEYNKYCEDIILVDNYERDRGFAYRFYLKKR